MKVVIILLVIIFLLFSFNSSSFTSSDTPIDVVYTWVDGKDPNWINKRNKYSSKLSTDSFRFESFNELKYSIISVQKFAPWVRNIYIVCDDVQQPNFIDFSDKIKLIKHSEIVPEKYLPLFNATAIESCIHHIPNLSENFLYFNDDMFLGRNVSVEDIFNKIYYIPRFGKKFKPVTRSDDEWVSNQKNGYSLLKEKFGSEIVEYFMTWHQCYFCKKSLMYSLENLFPEAYDYTLSQRFRKNDTDNSTITKSISLTRMQGMYGVFKKVYTLLPEKDCICISMKNGEGKRQLNGLLKNMPKFLCINNGNVDFSDFLQKLIK